MNEVDVRKLEAGNKVFVERRNDRYIGTVERVTATQVQVAIDFSFQGGTSRSVRKFSRLNRRRNREGSTYGAGREIGGLSSYLDGIPTGAEVRTYEDACDAKHRQRMELASQIRRRDVLLADLNEMVPTNCYVGEYDGTFSITIGAIPNPELLAKYASEISELVKRLGRSKA